MSSYKSQRPAFRSLTQRMGEQIASVKKHIEFIEESVVATKDDPKTSQDIQPESPSSTQEEHVYQSAVQLIPVNRAIDNGYEYRFVKPADVSGLSRDGWEAWTPQTTSDETSDDAHNMSADSCSCQPASYRIRYRDVMYLRPERCLTGWGDWDLYRPGQIVEWHEDSQDWHAPTKGPFMRTLQGGTSSAVDLFKVLNEQSRVNLTLREAVNFYREHVVQGDFKEFEECDFCAGDRSGSGKVLFRV